jgi:uncharacterized membrane protein YdjX (TVP38/TMEM64 family)
MEAPSVRVSAGLSRARWRIVLVVGALAAVVVAGRALDAGAALQGALAWINRLGPWAPAIFVLLYVAATVVPVRNPIRAF